MTEKITKRAIDALRSKAQAAGKTCYIFDSVERGFAALATKKGTVNYFIEYRLKGAGGSPKRLTIARHGPMTCEQARQLARQELNKVYSGTDVAQERRDAREKPPGLTFADGVEAFLKVHAKQTRYWKEKRARLTSGDVKALTSKPLATISRRHVADAIDKAQARSGAAARLLFADLRPFFKWAHEREHLDVNPMDGLRAPKTAPARERVLTDDEVKAFWKASGEISWPFGSMYRMLLLTGARREEVAGLKRGELDRDAGVWLLPGERTKNGRDHRIPLSLQVVQLLDEFGIGSGDLVFSTTGYSAPSGFSKAKKALDIKMKSILGARFKDWRIHDLRRTCATGMENLGVDTRVVETALNHVSGTKAGIVGVYQRADHRDAVRAAFEAWGAKVAEMVEEAPASNVVPLKRAG